MDENKKNNKLNINPGFLYLSFFIFIEISSYFSLFNPVFNKIFFIALVFGLFILTLYKLEYGLLAVVSELLIGSMGRLFSLEISGFSLSIRMAFWLVFLFVFIGKFIVNLRQEGLKGKYLQAIKDFHFLKYFLVLAIFIILGIINATFKGNSWNLVFSDFNGWLYFLLLFPTIIVCTLEKEKSLKNIKILFFISFLWLSLKTFLLLYVFTHSLSFSSEVYFWLRKTLVGEMTNTLSGWPRIFIQGQIFAAAGLFFSFWQNFKIKKNDYLKKTINFLLASLFAGVLLISFSRSFWLALILVLAFIIILSIKLYSWKKMFLAALWTGLVFAGAFSLLYLTTVIPWPRSGNFNVDFASRVNVSDKNEAAISSRWSLLPALMKEISQEPFFGQGYGATVTYLSQDPRVLENNPSGLYTTYAFEWGYLDIWLKLGIGGIIAYLLLLFFLIKESIILGLKKNNPILLSIASILLFLLIVNFFTPYLNHPLGIGTIIIVSCLINKYRVY